MRVSIAPREAAACEPPEPVPDDGKKAAVAWSSGTAAATALAKAQCRGLHPPEKRHVARWQRAKTQGPAWVDPIQPLELCHERTPLLSCHTQVTEPLRQIHVGCGIGTHRTLPVR